MRYAVLTLVSLAVIGFVTAAAIVGLGLYNVSAQAGHLPGVDWILHTTFRNSVKLRAPPIEGAPDLDDPHLIALGAGHYATACTPCHGDPQGIAMATARAMVPKPPPIRDAVANWRPNELHWIVENGVKMTGMPGWPVHFRPDEVWAVVAYLVQVKRQTPPRLPNLSAENDDSAPIGAAYCRTCHGSIDRFVPRLGIQDADYLAKALLDYRSGIRPSGIMQQAVSLVPPDALVELAAEFAEADLDAITRSSPSAAGEALATRGTREVPACTACHGPDAPAEQPQTPVLAGQDRAFLETQLRLWRDEVRIGSAKMTAAARALTDDQIALLAEWYAALPPQEGETR